MVMIFDSLHECTNMDYDRINQLVAFFDQALRQDSSGRLQILVTSRPYVHIQAAINSLKSPLLPLKMEDFDPKEDIELFLRSSLLEINQAHPPLSFQPWPSDVEFRLLVDKVAHRFIVAATVIRLLRQKDPAERPSFLDSLLQKQDLNNIDELYHHVISSSSHSAEAAPLLALVLNLSSPLSVNDISRLVEYDVRPILDSVASIISVPGIDSSCEPVAAYHTTLRDFLSNQKRSRGLYSDPAAVHCRLASACLDLMNRLLHKDICRLGDSSRLHSDIQDFGVRRDAAVSPALRYAALHWMHHFCQASRHDGTQQLLLSFVQEHLLHWIEALSVLAALYTCTLSLSEVIQTVMIDQSWRAPYAQATTISLLYDAYRLIHEFMEPIKLSSLHVYDTALALCPVDIQLRQVYQKDVKNANTFLIDGLSRKWSCVLRTIDFPNGVVRCLSHDGRLAAVERPGLGHADNVIELWDIVAGGMISYQHVPNSSFPVRYAFSRDCSCLVYHSSTWHCVKLWLLSARDVVSVEAPSASSVAISSDGRTLAWHSEDSRSLTVASRDAVRPDFTLPTFERQLSISEAPMSARFRLSFSPSGRRLLGHDGTKIRVWSTSTGELIWRDSGDERDYYTATEDEKYIIRLRQNQATDSNVSEKLEWQFSPVDEKEISLSDPRSHKLDHLKSRSVQRLKNIVKEEIRHVKPPSYYKIERFPGKALVKIDSVWYALRQTGEDAGIITVKSTDFLPFITPEGSLEIIDPSLSSPLPPTHHNASSNSQLPARKVLPDCNEHTLVMYQCCGTGRKVNVTIRTEDVRLPYSDPVRLPSKWHKSIVCSPDGRFLANRSDKSISVFRAHPSQQHIFTANIGIHLAKYSFSPRSTYFVLFVSETGVAPRVRLWQLDGGMELEPIVLDPEAEVNREEDLQVAFSHDESKLALARFVKLEPSQPFETEVSIYRLDSDHLPVKVCQFIARLSLGFGKNLAFGDQGRLSIAAHSILSSYNQEARSTSYRIVQEIAEYLNKPPSKFHRTSYEMDPSFEAREVKISPSLNQLVVRGFHRSINDYTILFLQSQAVERSRRRLELIRQDTGDTLYDTVTWSSIRLHSDGWLWNGSRQLRATKLSASTRRQITSASWEIILL
ncbi:hypothetical protein CONPUDRAFT_74510 [Coniophora puteana RWD-64-598 SS2]|uniref:WD40 repeat-like protein n=1 Tax=Coniophora puteana (strain RWD-64-598) TaxID=741705 RepID=A0A5M3MJW8_CONPW|nr:uncharacterized protein CONPUDRAFT_74510 [Coniophora puteana RWD-64-598 SS2]EIW78955.1 hypothetical protein CONPUDRAFT_74510 [Coniophora puteana RWD-64-598 SS2]